MQLSTIIGKRILSPAGEQLGYVTGAYLTRDLTKLAALAAVDDEEEEFYISARSVLACTDAVIATKTRLQSPTGVPAPIGRPAFSSEGTELGRVSDWLCGEEPAFELAKAGERTKVPASHVLAEETVIVYPAARPTPKRKTEKRTSPKKKSPSEKKVSAAPLPQQHAEDVKGLPPSAAEELAASAQEEPVPLVERCESVNMYGFRGNLLGRKVKKSVYDINGNLIALAGERITPELLSRARRAGRLLALTVNTLTNIL